MSVSITLILLMWTRILTKSYDLFETILGTHEYVIFTFVRKINRKLTCKNRKTFYDSLLLLDHTINRVGEYTVIPPMLCGLLLLEVLFLHGSVATAPAFAENPSFFLMFFFGSSDIAFGTLLSYSLASYEFVVIKDLVVSQAASLILLRHD